MMSSPPKDFKRSVYIFVLVSNYANKIHIEFSLFDESQCFDQIFISKHIQHYSSIEYGQTNGLSYCVRV